MLTREFDLSDFLQESGGVYEYRNTGKILITDYISFKLKRGLGGD